MLLYILFAVLGQASLTSFTIWYLLRYDRAYLKVLGSKPGLAETDVFETTCVLLFGYAYVIAHIFHRLVRWVTEYLNIVFYALLIFLPLGLLALMRPKDLEWLREVFFKAD